MNTFIQDRLENIERQKSEEGNIYWTISQEVGDLLHKLIKENNYKNGLEIGASIGYSTLYIASALDQNKGKLTTIESSKKRIPILEDNIAKSRLKNITLLKGHAPEILNSVKDFRYDFVFIDATKYEYISYVKYLLDNRLMNNSMIVADNIDSHRESLQDYISFMENHPKIINSHIKEGTGLLISRYCE